MRLLFPYILKVFFVFIFTSCTLFTLDDEIFQIEEEEFYANQPKKNISSSDNSLDVEDEDILKDIFSDSSVETEDEMRESDNLLPPKTPKKKWIPLKKIPSTTWKSNGKWINAVYIVRPADSLNQISTMIFSEDKSEELKSINPLLKRRDIKVGDKIYYSSPLRPNDRNNFYHYYEDTNQIAQTYDLGSGDNIRVVSERLLGHKNSWKEIWATNPQLKSKGDISEPVTIQYWNTAPPAPIVEKTPPPAEDSIDDSMIADEDMPMEEPIEEEQPIEDIEPSPMNDTMMEDMDEQPSWYKENMKIIGASILLIIVAFLLIRIIRERRNRSDFDFSQTHIDIDSLEE